MNNAASANATGSPYSSPPDRQSLDALIATHRKAHEDFEASCEDVGEICWDNASDVDRQVDDIWRRRGQAELAALKVLFAYVPASDAERRAKVAYVLEILDFDTMDEEMLRALLASFL